MQNPNYYKTNMKRVSTSLCILFALLSAGCVDRGFDLAETSGEITIGGEELVVPLAEIAPITLSSLLKENETITSDENGVYQIKFSSFGDDPTKYESLSVDGIEIPAITGLSPKLDPISFSFQQLPTSLSMSGFSHKFNVDYPTINSIMDIKPIEVEQSLNITIPGLPSSAQQGQINEYVANYIPAIEYGDGDKAVFNADIELLQQLKKIDWVEFGDDKYPGSLFEIKIDLNGLAGINGGGKFKFNVEFPNGYYLCDKSGNDFPDESHNIFQQEIELKPNQNTVEFLTYLRRIDFSDYSFENGLLSINDEIKYNYNLELKVSAGTYNLAAAPKFSIKAKPVYKDIEVVINQFDMDKVSYPVNYAFDGMPGGISIKKVAFKDTYLTLYLKGLDWLEIKDNKTNQTLPIQVKVSLPECMHFAQTSNFSNNTLSASAGDLAKGIRLKLDYIDCSGKDVKQENGQLLISSEVTAEIDLKSMNGSTVLVSSLVPPVNPVVVEVAISDTTLNLNTNSTVVEWSEEKSFDLDLGNNVPSISQSVEIPEMITSVECITIGKAGSDNDPVSIEFALTGNNSFPVEKLDVNVAINLGKMLRPTQATLDSGIITKSASGDYILAINETWEPRKKSLTKRVEFEALENIPAISNGKITLNQKFPITGSVKIKDGQNIDLSNIESAKIDVDVKIDDIEAKTFTGGINIAVEPERMVVELGEMGDLGININSLKLNPILNIKLKDNPTGIPFHANIAISTYDSDGNALNTIEIPTINVAGSGASSIVLSTSRNASKFDGENTTFIAIDELAKLLSNGIPAKIAVDMAVATDNSSVYTIDLARAAKGYKIEYQYEVLVPFELDGNVDISYETTITDLGATFDELADTTNGLKVGDVGLIAEFGTTIPFNIVLSAELVNKDGTTEGVKARLNIHNCVIKGSSNNKRSVSKIDFDFDLGENRSLEDLKGADGLRLKFGLYNTDNGVVALSKDQYIDGKLKLRVRDGLTLDISSLTNGNKEE